MTIRLDAVCLTLGGAQVLRGISASFEPGRVTAILGPNGAGKTSLLRILCGLRAPDSGVAELDSKPIAAYGRDERARLLGYLPQETNPVWNLRAREMVALGRLPHRSGFAASGADDEAINRAMADTDTTALADRPVNAMSGGERARVQFARVLAGEPAWILADEPLANLDPPYQRDLLNLLRASASAGKGVVVILHDLNAAARVADDIVLIRNGELVAAGPSQAVLTRANLAETYSMAFDILEHGGATLIKPAA